jgi:hydrogenase nickel incorporation protein HypA/HybF
MHEMAVTESILSIARTQAEKYPAARVTTINLVLGSLSSLVDDSITFYWDIISRDTPCAGAALVFHRLPARLVCMDCLTEYTVEAGISACPNCGSVKVKVLSGSEFRVDSIEITEEDNVQNNPH